MPNVVIKIMNRQKNNTKNMLLTHKMNGSPTSNIPNIECRFILSFHTNKHKDIHEKKNKVRKKLYEVVNSVHYRPQVK